VRDALASVRRLLDVGGPQVLDVSDGRDAITPSIELSLRFLAETHPNDLKRFEELAVCGPLDIRGSVLEKYWRLSAAEVLALCLRFAAMHLVRVTRLEPLRIQLHAVIHDYLRHRIGDPRFRELSRRLADCYQ